MRDWRQVLTSCGVAAAVANEWAPIFGAVIVPGTFSLGDAEVDDFLGQVLHESAMLTRLEEGLNYSAERLCQVWPSRFPSLEAAQPYAHNPRGLANHVYGGRGGNVGPNDGWLFRGSGLIQCTFRSNFAQVGRALGKDLEGNPELLRHDLETALRASIAWWEHHVPDGIMGNGVAVRRAVNGGTVGLSETLRLTSLAQEALKC